MTSGNPALSETVIKNFCELCSTAYVSWYIRKCLFHEQNNPDFKYLQHHFFETFFRRLCNITQEHWILQIAKLHDPAIQGKRINLTIKYVTDYGNWDTATATTLKELKEKMESLLFKPTGPARNKLIAHNDLISILADEPLGKFEVGEDDQYFEHLQKFAEIVHHKVCGEFLSTI